MRLRVLTWLMPGRWSWLLIMSRGCWRGGCFSGGPGSWVRRWTGQLAGLGLRDSPGSRWALEATGDRPGLGADHDVAGAGRVAPGIIG